MATFSSFKELDGIIINENDKIYLKGSLHTVKRSTIGDYYLFNNTMYKNDWIFDQLGINKREILNTLGIEFRGGNFPQVLNLSDLTRITLELFKKIEEQESNVPKIRFSNSFVEFLEYGASRSKVCKIILENKKLLDTSKVNFISNRYDEFISYMPTNKEQEINGDGSWSRKNRQVGKPAKIIKQIFTEELLKLVTDNDFEIFANLYKSVNDNSGRFQIVEGSDIKKWYNESLYQNNQGTLSNSCMRYDHCQHFFNLYTENPSVIKMLILTDSDNLLLGRAILWHLPDRTKLMDRIYGTDATIEKFKGWGLDNDYYIKQKNNNSTDSKFINKNGDELKYIEIILSSLTFIKYPYMDTFCYMDYDRTLLTNDSNAYEDGYELRNTGGGCSSRDEDDDDDYNDDERTCYISGRTIVIGDNAVWIERIGEYVHEEYSAFCDHSQEYILLRDAFCCTYSGNWYHEDYMIIDIKGNNVYMNHPDLVILNNGEYCHSDYSFVCEHDGKIYHEDECSTVEVDGIEHYVFKENVEDFKSKIEESI